MIPIQNIYYMLSYAFQVLNEQGYKNIATEQFHNTGELMAAILEKGIAIQLKRGLGKEYIPQTEALSSLRGKIDIAESIKTQSMLRKQLICTYDEFSVKGCIGILIKNGLPAEEIEILSKDVEIDGEIYTLSSNIKYKTNCITETSTSISVDEDGEIDTNTSWSERFKSKASLSIHGIEVPYNLFPDYSNRMSKAVLKIPFPFSFRLDIGVNSDLNLNSARDQIIYDEKWLTFEENLYRIICRRLKDTLSSSDWKILNEIIQKNNTDTFSRVANSFE